MPMNTTQNPFPIAQPKGEDFFVASIEFDTDNDPCWNEGLTVLGNWDSFTESVSQFFSALPLKYPRFTAKLYQGPQARKKLKSLLAEELRYQQQKHSQPNN